MSATTCSRCCTLFEAGEEYGNAPGRLCTSCWRAGYRAYAAGNLYRVCIGCQEARMPWGSLSHKCNACFAKECHVA